MRSCAAEAGLWGKVPVVHNSEVGSRMLSRAEATSGHLCMKQESLASCSSAGLMPARHKVSVEEETADPVSSAGKRIKRKGLRIGAKKRGKGQRQVGMPTFSPTNSFF